MKKIFYIISITFIVACSSGSGSEDVEPKDENKENPTNKEDQKNESPSAFNLIYPTPNLLCLDNNIEFKWSDSKSTNQITYNLIIASDPNFKVIKFNRNVRETKLKLTLEKGKAFYYKVIAKDSKSNEVSSDEIAFFVEADAIINHIPFESKIISPTNNQKLDSIDSISLTWSKAEDVDNDPIEYKIYLYEKGNQQKLISSTKNTTINTSIKSGLTYLWRVDVFDGKNTNKGNISTFSVK